MQTFLFIYDVASVLDHYFVQATYYRVNDLTILYYYYPSCSHNILFKKKKNLKI